MTLLQKKMASITVVVALYSVLFFLLAALLLAPNGERSTFFVVLTILSALIWSGLLSTAFAFVFDRFSVSLLLASLGPIAVIVVGRFSIAAFIGAALLFLFSLTAKSIFAREINSRVTFNTRTIFKEGTKMVILGLAVALICLSFPLIQSQAIRGELELPVQYVETIMTPLTPLISNYLPGYQPKATIDDIIDAQIAEQSKEVAPGFVLPPEQKSNIRLDISKKLRVPIKGNETVAMIAAAYVNGYIRTAAGGGGIIMIVILTAIALLTLRALIPLLVWPTLAVIAVFVYIAQRVGLVAILRTQVTIERMRL